MNTTTVKMPNCKRNTLTKSLIKDCPSLRCALATKYLRKIHIIGSDKSQCFNVVSVIIGGLRNAQCEYTRAT